ncbi:acrosin-like [Elgaria multicarinata webbii]|uniref:acrosin-like n=1 Tax=Elgaria multicarinata webbii TaxID=159646 RepID=UPI002FCCD92F
MRRPLFPLLALITICPLHAIDDKCSGICGRRPLATSHSIQVVGDIETLPGSWPWMVSIRTPFRSGYQHTCGGSLISTKWILTAAHCFKDKRHLTNWELVLGAAKLSRPGPDAEVRFPKRVVEHEHYQPHHQINDIALVELDDPIMCNDYIQPACLLDSSVEISAMAHCYIAGWGSTQEKSEAPSDILKEAKVDLVSLEKCNSSNWYFGSITVNNLCAGFEGGGIDTCQGDSGGPLMCREERSERYWVVGVTSWGLGCARAQKPGVYTSTQLFYDWIQGYTKMPLQKTTTPTPEPTTQTQTTSSPSTQTQTTSESSTQTQTTSKVTTKRPPLQPKPVTQTSPQPETSSPAPSTSSKPEPQPLPLQPRPVSLLQYALGLPLEPELETQTKATSTATTTTTRRTTFQAPRRKPRRRTKTIISSAHYSSSWNQGWPNNRAKPKSQT